MNRFFCAIVIASFASQIVFAQGAADGLRYSQTFCGGTARFVSMGGAFGALGGDFGSLSYNPAGLGVYRTSEFTITPSFKSRNISSAYNGETKEDSRTRMYFDNVGFVLSFKPFKSEETGLVHFNMGFGYNRNNDFYANSLAEGNNQSNSIMDYFETRANATNIYFNDLYESSKPFQNSNLNGYWDVVMAWNTLLLYDTLPGTNGRKYYSALPFADDKVRQKNVIETKGSSGEFVMSFATNISNKFYLGASLGINNFDYSYTSTYSEDAFETNGSWGNGDRFYYSDYIQKIDIAGTGYTFKVGGIFKPIDGLRIGAAIHTPTYYSFEDTYSYTMKSNFDYFENGAVNEVNFTCSTPIGKYKYHFETPFRAIGSIAYTFQDKGLISVDFEHLDYSTMRFRDGGNGDDFSDVNADASSIYKGVNNIRVGGEVKVGDFALRAGYGYYPSPYKSGYINDKAKTNQFSGGIGYRSGNFVIDAAYLLTKRSEEYIFYDFPGVNTVKTDMSDGKFLVTLGFKF